MRGLRVRLPRLAFRLVRGPWGVYRDDFLFGTFAPFLRTLDKPIAMACLRLFHFTSFPSFAAVLFAALGLVHRFFYFDVKHEGDDVVHIVCGSLKSSNGMANSLSPMPRTPPPNNTT